VGARRALCAGGRRHGGQSAKRKREGEDRRAGAPAHAHTIVNGAQDTSKARASARVVLTRRHRRSRLCTAMSPTWIWMQAAIVVFVVIGMIVAITKLA